MSHLGIKIEEIDFETFKEKVLGYVEGLKRYGVSYEPFLFALKPEAVIDLAECLKNVVIIKNAKDIPEDLFIDAVRLDFDEDPKEYAKREIARSIANYLLENNCIKFSEKKDFDNIFGKYIITITGIAKIIKPEEKNEDENL